MKKRLISVGAVCALTVLLLVVALVSCEKAVFDVNDTAGDKDGNLRVSVYQIEQTSFASLTRAAASEACTRLNFLIYNLDGSRVKAVNQVSSDKNFGQCSFQLDEGDYVLVVVGHSANGNPTSTNPQKISFTNAQGYTDTFLSSGDITVGDEPLEIDVTLERIVALCRFVLTDDYPAGVAKMQFYYTGGSGAFDAYTGLGSVNSKQTVTFDVSDGQKQFDLYTFLHDVSDNIALKVTALDADGNELFVREFDVPMEQNHITWLTGAFFNGTGSSSTTVTGVTVDTDWAGETHLTF
ncbi:MAG: FimB/Mfa2 family fimbrial subunit [Bacteroidaceae bacterium]|nr:FimB/Mfa2 family fimbrial subunit [Bacteroidaceae bacterium]